jgi:predicted site-specific integrase-resolvase
MRTTILVDTLPDTLYKTSDVARRFNVDHKTVSFWVEKGRLLPVMDVGNKNRHSYRFHPKDVEEFYQAEKEKCQRDLDRRAHLLKAVKE